MHVKWTADCAGPDTDASHDASWSSDLVDDTATADECVSCDLINMTDPSVSLCSACTGTAESDCYDGTCAPGYHTYDSMTATCTACIAVANAAANITLNCTSEYDSRLSGGCATGYLLVNAGNSSVVADRCILLSCAVINMTDPSVSLCSACTGSHESDCYDGTCVPGYHTYDSMTATCTACTAVADAAANSTLNCTSEYDSRLSGGCATGYYLVSPGDSLHDDTGGYAGRRRLQIVETPCVTDAECSTDGSSYCDMTITPYACVPSDAAGHGAHPSSEPALGPFDGSFPNEPAMEPAMTGGCVTDAECSTDGSSYCEMTISPYACVPSDAAGHGAHPSSEPALEPASFPNEPAMEPAMTGGCVTDAECSTDGSSYCDISTGSCVSDSGGDASWSTDLLDETESDECAACNDFHNESSVVQCLSCYGGTASDCSAAECSTGFHTYDSFTMTCTPCTPVLNAVANSSYSCTSEYDTRLFSASACEGGYYHIAGDSDVPYAATGRADACESCSLVDVSSQPSVASCTYCSNGTITDCLDAVCSIGFHTYDPATAACSPCSTVQSAAPDAIYNCTSEYDSEVSHCSSGHFLTKAPRPPDVCTVCTVVANAAPNATYTCTSAYDSSVNRCASGHTHMHNATHGDMCTPMQTCTTFQCAASGMVHIATANSTLWPTALQPPHETCCVFNCLRPHNATGYNLTRIIESLAADPALFSVSGLECAAGYKGIPEALPCALVDQRVAAGRRLQAGMPGGDYSGGTGGGCTTDAECSTDGSSYCDLTISPYACVPSDAVGHGAHPSSEPALEPFDGSFPNEPAMEPAMTPLGTPDQVAPPAWTRVFRQVRLCSISTPFLIHF